VDIAALTGLVAVALAVPGTYLALRQWRGEEEESLLFIPAPPYGQNPLAPDFWVFPPVSCGDGDAVVIAGKIVNDGPAAARSVRVYADPEPPRREAFPAVKAAFRVVVAANPERDEEGLWEEFSQFFRNKESFVPLLRAGEDLPFVVIARYPRPNAYIERIREQEGTMPRTRDWTQDGRQAHTVHLSYRTKRGKLLELGPNDLCAPGENT